MSIRMLRKIIAGYILFEILVTIYTLSIPKEYLSTSTLLAPESESPGVVLNTPYGQLQNPELSNGAISSQAILAMIESRRLAKRVIKRFKLSKLYGTTSEEYTIKKYLKNLMVNFDPDRGVIQVGFIAQKPVLAKDVVSFILTELDTLNAELNLTSRKPIAKVIDKPNLPQRKYKPHLSYNLILGTFLYITIIIAFFILKEVSKGIKIE